MSKKLKDVTLREVSFVDKPATQIPFLIVKNERGEELNILEEMFSEIAGNGLFSKSEIDEIDDSLRIIGDLDDDTLNAFGTLLSIAGTNPQAVEKQKLLWPSFFAKETNDDNEDEDEQEVTKGEGNWPSFTSQCPRPSQVE